MEKQTEIENKIHSNEEKLKEETIEFIQLQPSLVLKFIKNNLPQNSQIQISAQYRANFTKILSIFILYLNSMAIQEKFIKTKKISSNYTEKELKAAFGKIGFQEFLDQLDQEEKNTQKKNEEEKAQQEVIEIIEEETK